MMMLMVDVSADKFPRLLLDDLSFLAIQVENVLGGGMLDIQLLCGRLDGLLVHNNQINQLFPSLNSLNFTSKEISS